MALTRNQLIGEQTKNGKEEKTETMHSLIAELMFWISNKYFYYLHHKQSLDVDACIFLDFSLFRLF